MVQQDLLHELWGITYLPFASIIKNLPAGDKLPFWRLADGILLIRIKLNSPLKSTGMKNSTHFNKLSTMKITIMKALIILVITGGTVFLHAQNFEWAKQMGGTGADNGQSVAVDASGNVYTTGGFEGTVDFDPGPGESILTSAGYTDIFISKVSASGNLVWVKQIGGDKDDYGNSITLDASGNVLTTGYFKDTVDFDPGVGTFILLIDAFYYGPTGTQYIKGSDIFISKLDADGNFVWAKQIGGNLTDFGTGIVVDGSNNVLTTGEFSNHYNTDSTDFDPGPGVFNLGVGGGFISKLDASGNFLWAKQFGWNNSSSSFCGSIDGVFTCIFDENYTASFQSVALDASDNVYTTGSFVSTTDFDPGPGTFNLIHLGNRDAFVCKLNSSGNFVWAKQFGGSSSSALAEDIAIDGSGNVYTTGYFTGTVDFNPGAATNNLKSTATGSADIFISKLNSSGNYVWAKGMGGTTEDRGASIALDAQSNVYTTGYFSAKADFDPGAGKYFLTPAGNDIFISKLSTAGAFVWARKLGGTGDDQGKGIAIDTGTNVLTTGYFSGTADFDPNSGTYHLISAGGSDAFVQKMNQTIIAAPFIPELTHASDFEFNVFPNPAQDRVTISFTNDKEGRYEIDLLDITGKLMATYSGISFVGRNEREFDIRHLSAGMYQIAFLSGNSLTLKRLIID